MFDMSDTHYVQPAGWYDDGTGQQRWWDGKDWTTTVAVPPPQVPRVRKRPNFYGFTALVGPIIPIAFGIAFQLAILGAIGTFVGVTFAAIGLNRKGESKASSIVAMIIWAPLAILSLVSILVWLGQNAH